MRVVREHNGFLDEMDLDAEFIDRHPIFDVAIETISLHLLVISGELLIHVANTQAGSRKLDSHIRGSVERSDPGRFVDVEVSGATGGTSESVRSRPFGLFGLVYWYLLVPVHAVIFGGMLREIARRACAAATDRTIGENQSRRARAQSSTIIGCDNQHRAYGCRLQHEKSCAAWVDVVARAPQRSDDAPQKGRRANRAIQPAACPRPVARSARWGEPPTSYSGVCQ